MKPRLLALTLSIAVLFLGSSIAWAQAPAGPGGMGQGGMMQMMGMMQQMGDLMARAGDPSDEAVLPASPPPKPGGAGVRLGRQRGAMRSA